MVLLRFGDRQKDIDQWGVAKYVKVFLIGETELKEQLPDIKMEINCKNKIPKKGNQMKDKSYKAKKDRKHRRLVHEMQKSIEKIIRYRSSDENLNDKIDIELGKLLNVRFELDEYSNVIDDILSSPQIFKNRKD
jgi:hypothetical protein